MCDWSKVHSISSTPPPVLLYYTQYFTSLIQTKVKRRERGKKKKKNHLYLLKHCLSNSNNGFMHFSLKPLDWDWCLEKLYDEGVDLSFKKQKKRESKQQFPHLFCCILFFLGGLGLYKSDPQMCASMWEMIKFDMQEAFIQIQ